MMSRVKKRVATVQKEEEEWHDKRRMCRYGRQGRADEKLIFYGCNSRL